ncbi:MAG: hypothetical protein ABJA67_04875 [Chthonomonadales bacterium]
MRQDSPLKPGTPAFSPEVRSKMLKFLPIISVIVAILIVSQQYIRKSRISAELIVVNKEMDLLEAKYHELLKTHPKTTLPADPDDHKD